VTEVKTDYNQHTAIVTFDDTQTNVPAMRDALAKGGFPVEGEPQFLK
jgi:copper chaperone CopZ